MKKEIATGCACAIILMLNISGLSAQDNQRRPQLKSPPTLQVNPNQAPQTFKVIPNLQFTYSFDCRAQGTPVEFPNDIVIINKGPGVVPQGTQVHWEIAKPNYKGNYTLPALNQGQHIFISGVAGSGVQAGTPCTVTVLK